MSDAMPVASDERAVAEADTGKALQGEEQAKDEEDKSQVTTVEEQSSSGEEQKNGGDGEGEDEVGECPFCLFMKSGPCRDSFISWEKCIEDAEKEKEDIVEKCHKVTFILKECMEQNSDYYEPVLQAEKAMGDAALEEEEEDAKAPQSSEDANPTDLQVHSESEDQNSVDSSPSQARQFTQEHHVHKEELSLHASPNKLHEQSSDAAGEGADSRGTD